MLPFDQGGFHRWSSRLAAQLRQEGKPLGLGELLGKLFKAYPWPSHLESAFRFLLDGRFRQEEHIALWEWYLPFPPDGEAVVALDVETTGLTPQADQIIELGLVRWEAGGQLYLSRLVDPGRPLPARIVQLTGIHPSELAGAPSIEEVLEEVYPYLQGSTVIAHNASFDLGFLKPSLRRIGYTWDPLVVDTIFLARRALPYLRRRGLDQLLWALDLPAEGRHRALGDAAAALAAAREMYYILTAGTPRRLASLCVDATF